jgi:hypothetical protein
MSTKWTRKEGCTDMTIDVALAALVATIVIGPFVALALAATRYGADSRPGIGERDPRPWLVGR